MTYHPLLVCLCILSKELVHDLIDTNCIHTSDVIQFRFSLRVGLLLFLPCPKQARRCNHKGNRKTGGSTASPPSRTIKSKLSWMRRNKSFLLAKDPAATVNKKPHTQRGKSNVYIIMIFSYHQSLFSCKDPFRIFSFLAIFCVNNHYW